MKVRRQSAKKTLHVVFAGGGTGGHLMPGAATAEALHRTVPEARCLFLVTDRRTERQCSHAVRAFQTSRVPATPVSGAAEMLLFPARCAATAAQVLAALRRFRADVVVGLGGSNSLIPVLMGRMSGCRTALLEGNAIPGRAVRVLAPLADRVFVQWPESARGLRARRVSVSGLPVRRELFAGDGAAARRRLGLSSQKTTILVMGGSQGAQALNRAVQAAMPALPATAQVLHLTGVDHLPEALRSVANRLSTYRPIGYLESMPDAYAAADLVMARAGASTLAELTALGLPAVLVPYPHATDGHQRANARVLERAGAARVMLQSEIEPRRMAKTLWALAADDVRLARMSRAARDLGAPDAAHNVALALARMAGREPETPQTTVQDKENKRRMSQAA